MAYLKSLSLDTALSISITYQLCEAVIAGSNSHIHHMSHSHCVTAVVILPELPHCTNADPPITARIKEVYHALTNR